MRRNTLSLPGFQILFIPTADIYKIQYSTSPTLSFNDGENASKRAYLIYVRFHS